MTKVIGLTGGIATGKSTVSQYLRTKGLKIIDADIVARQVVELGTKGLALIQEAFGKEVINPDGSLNRAQLGKVVFADSQARQKLNQILHPLIFRTILGRLEELKARRCPVVVLDIPLLFETGWEQRCDLTWVVACSPQQQLTRLMARDHLDQAAAQARIAAQYPLTEKMARADVVLMNDNNQSGLYHQVDQALAKLS
ncbi:dephospho-CoA kinase [uncultured Limosilactobacillus sp.]|uniref:dephospho-CoA kinase n=1 Tax=uncultured Limosilactobacillus sp. TaxID=2837629 RepID=UPI0025DCAF1A|nr:dephospho-CoA kinase [uncultured Limosilactobacillus sp.]